MTCLLKWSPAATLPIHKHPELKQSFVLESSFFSRRSQRCRQQYFRRNSSKTSSHSPGHSPCERTQNLLQAYLNIIPKGPRGAKLWRVQVGIRISIPVLQLFLSIQIQKVILKKIWLGEPLCQSWGNRWGRGTNRHLQKLSKNPYKLKLSWGSMKYMSIRKHENMETMRNGSK